MGTDLVYGHPGCWPARPDELGPGLGHVLVDEILPLQDDVLTLPVLDQVEGLKRVDDVRLGDGRDPTQVGNAKGAPKVAQDF